MIERYDLNVRSPGEPLAQWLEEWKRLRREGWNVTVLLSTADKRVVALAYHVDLAPP